MLITCILSHILPRCMPTLQHLSAAPPTGVLLPLAVDCSSPLASPGGSDTHSRRRPTLSSAHALAPRVDFDPTKPYPWKEQSSVRCRCICVHSGPSDRLQHSHCKHKYKRVNKEPDWPSMSGPPQVYLAWHAHNTPAVQPTHQGCCFSYLLLF